MAKSIKRFDVMRYVKQLAQAAHDANPDFRAEKIVQMTRAESPAEEFSPYELEWLAEALSIQGAWAVLKGDMGGWLKLRRSVEQQYWVIRMWCHQYDSADAESQKEQCVPVLTSKVALYFAELLVYGDEDKARWLGCRLGDQAMGRWDDSPLGAFMACLYQLWRGRPVEERVPRGVDLGVYAEILEAWEEGGDRLATAMMGACEYHTQNCDESSGYPAFEWRPYTIYPVEILGIGRVRKGLGLETPGIKHALLDTPLGNPPTEVGVGEDVSLKLMLGKMKAIWPGFDLAAAPAAVEMKWVAPAKEAREKSAGEAAEVGKYREVLALFGYGEKEAAEAEWEEDMVVQVTKRIEESKFGIVMDWRGYLVGELLEPVAKVAAEFGVDIEIVDADAGGATLHVTVDHEVRKVTVREKRKAVAAIEQAARGRLVFRWLKLYTGTDSYGYAVLSPERWEAVRQVMGEEFGEVFAGE